MEIHLCDTGETRWGRSVMELVRPLKYRRTFGDIGQETVANLFVRVIVPKDYRTDFASVPRFLWPIISPMGPWRTAAVIHDYLCDIKVPRPLADAIFYSVMLEDSRIKAWQRCLIYAAVRAYWIGWGKWFGSVQK